MDRLDRTAGGQFSQPTRQIVLMLIVLGLVGFLGYIAYPRVAPIFLANLWLNGVIGAVFVFGVLTCFLQVWQIYSSVSWIEGFVEERPGHQFTSAPRFLATLAALLRAQGARVQLGPSSSRSILDSVATRIDEARDITRYIVNVLIFLGLLGTFYGLATTVPAVVDTIRSLAPAEDETLGGAQVFANLITGLESQLGGMGVAFSSSLLGLAGSLVVGLLELFASHGQNRFYRELEDWLSTITRVGISSGEGEGEGMLGAAGVVLDRMAEQIDGLAALYEASEGSRQITDTKMRELSDSVTRLVDRVEADTAAQARLSELAASQKTLAEAIREWNARPMESETDGEARMRLRSMDVQLLRILEELATGRQEMLDDLRSELRHLNQSVNRLGQGQ